MNVVCLGSKGSAVTTTALALAGGWPVTSAPVVMVEADAAGGDIAARFDLAASPSLLTAAASERLADQYMASGLTRAELAAANKCTVGYVGDALRDVLVKHGVGSLGASALALNAPEPLRLTVWAMATGQPAAGVLEERWIEVLKRVYIDTDGKWNHSWNHNQPLPQKIVDELATRGGAMPCPR